MPNSKIRILIVDDHPVVRRGLTELIRLTPDLEVCGEAGGLGEARETIKSLNPDVVLIDMWLEDGHGLDLIKELGSQKDPPKTLVISMHEDASYTERALRAGANGYLFKSGAVDSIADAIRQVARGEIYLHPSMTARLLRGLVGRGVAQGNTPEDLLTDRELEVFGLLGKGLSSRHISERLTLSVKTIDTHREHIKQKLGLSGASELVLRAVLWAHEKR